MEGGTLTVNFIAQLGWIALNIILLYALTARWSESQTELGPAR